MADMIFKKAVQVAKSTWANAKKRAESSGGMGTEIEDGRYKAVIKDAKFEMSRSSNRLQVAWTYEIQDGEYKGKTKMDWDGADTEDNQMWLGRKLVRLGYEIPEDIDEVTSILMQIVKKKPAVRITLKTKGEFQKVYVDKLLVGEEAEGMEDSDDEVESAPTAEEAGVDETTLSEGMNVSFTYKGKTVEGVVIEILEDEQKARVKTEDGKVFKLGADMLTIVEKEEEEEEAEEEEVPEEPAAEEEGEEDEEEEEETPAKKVTKKKPETKKKK